MLAQSPHSTSSPWQMDFSQGGRQKEGRLLRYTSPGGVDRCPVWCWMLQMAHLEGDTLTGAAEDREEGGAWEAPHWGPPQVPGG